MFNKLYKLHTRTLNSLGLYYGVSICLVTCASALAVLTLNIHHRGVRGNEVPAVIRRIFLGYFSRMVFLHFDLSIDKNWRTASIAAAHNPVGSGGEGNASGGSIALQARQTAVSHVYQSAQPDLSDTTFRYKFIGLKFACWI